MIWRGIAHWDAEALAERLQHAALDPALWPDAMSAINAAVGGAGALLFSSDAHFQDFPVTPDLADQARIYVEQGWHLRDERYRGLPAMLRNGFMTDQDCLAPDERKHNPFYQDFLRANGFGDFFGLGFKAGDDVWCLSLQRGVDQEPFNAYERSRLLQLWRPLSDAATLARQLGFARALGMAEALHSTEHPAIVFDGAGRVLALNAQAEALVGDCIDIRARKLIFGDDESQRRFETLLAVALRGELTFEPRAALQTVRNRHLRKVAIRAIALRGFAQFSFANARVMLLIGNPPVESDVSQLALLSVFGLTAAEARVAREIANGASVAQVAEKFQVSYETARSQLRSVYAKTDTHRQGQLVALLSGVLHQ